MKSFAVPKAFVSVLFFLSAASAVALARTECTGTINGVSATVVHTGQIVDGDIDNGYQAYCAASEKIYVGNKLAGEGDLVAVEWGADHHVLLQFFGSLPKVLNDRSAPCSEDGIETNGTCLWLVPEQRTFQSWENSKWHVLNHPEDSFVCHEARDLNGECLN